MTEESLPESEDRQAMAKAYDGIRNRLFAVRIVAVVVLLALFLLSGASGSLAGGLTARFGGRWGWVNLVYVLVATFGFSAGLFPLTFYDHVLERHYGLSRETFGQWMADYLKSLALDLMLAGVLFSALYALLRLAGDRWWIWATGFYVLFSIVLSALFPVLIMPLFHKFEPLEDRELADAVREMMRDEGIDVVGVYKWGLSEKTSTANAAFTGLGRSRRIVLGDTLLDGYERDEILAILAHEVGHYKNRDMLRLMTAGSLLALVGFFLAHVVLTRLSGRFGIEHVYDIGGAPLFVFSLFLFSLVSMPLTNLLSRQREYAADAYAVRRLSTPEPLVSALEKLADQNLADREPAPWVEFLLHGHPSIARRARRAREVIAG